MDRARSSQQQAGLQPGAHVFSADGQNLGQLAEIAEDHLIVEGGGDFGEYLFIPRAAVARGEPGRVFLNLPSETLRWWSWIPLQRAA